MLDSSWHLGQSFVIQARAGLKPNMTVAELFAAGPMRLRVTCDPDHGTRLQALVPSALEIVSEPDHGATDADHYQADLFGSDPDLFDRFLQEEAVRVEQEAATIEHLKVERTRSAGGREG